MSKPQIIFISGRFRSGTSLLWHLFEQLDGYCAWYEPLHTELLTNIDVVRPKSDHKGVQDYWESYRKKPDFKQYYQPIFGHDRLYLSADQSWPELKKYLDHLISLSAPSVPVLQFNRMDLRLGWLKHYYPEAMMVHIYRQPIPLWFSCRKHLSMSGQRDESHPDAYDLMQWSASLSELFPMLCPKSGRHSYYRHYFIYVLSRLMAQSYADYSFSLEQDVFESSHMLDKLSELCSLNTEQKNRLEKLIHVPEPLNTGDDLQELTAIQENVDEMLQDTGLANYFPGATPNQIRSLHADYWQQFKIETDQLVSEILQGLSSQKSALAHALNARLDDSSHE